MSVIEVNRTKLIFYLVSEAIVGFRKHVLIFKNWVMMYHRKEESNERTASVNEISISLRKQQNVT